MNELHMRFKSTVPTWRSLYSFQALVHLVKDFWLGIAVTKERLLQFSPQCRHIIHIAYVQWNSLDGRYKKLIFYCERKNHRAPELEYVESTPVTALS